jgi:hypothetical protein
MNSFILLLLSFLFISCSSRVTKFGSEKVFKQKSFNLNAQYHQDNIEYYVTRENEEHCFDSNPENKEIITVKSVNIEYAINHFYKRMVNVDINVYRSNLDGPQIRVNTKESVNFNLEMASCSFESIGGLFSNSYPRYTSFRLANK